jgi:hypothetical protein
VHVWKFEDDNDRRAFRRRLFADKNFMEAPDAGAMGSPSLTRWLALLKDVAVAVLGGARRLRDVLREVAVDRQTMLLIGSAIVAMLVIASVLVGPGGLLMSR